MSQSFAEPVKGREINYVKILQTILSRWYWIAVCLLLACSAAWVYLSIIHPRYSSTASLMLNEKKSDIANILDPEGNNNSTVESFNQAQEASFIIRSESFLAKAISKLNYRYSFYVKDEWSTNELYPQSPFTIDIIQQDSALFYSGLFAIKWLGGGSFTLSENDEIAGSEKVHHYGDTIHAPGLAFRIVKSYALKNFKYYFRFHTRESLVTRTINSLSVDPQNLNILSISHTDVNPYFSADVLNAISKEYIAYEAIQRSKTSSKRLEFIDNKIIELTREVNETGDKMQQMEKDNKLNNLQVKIQADIAKLAQLQGQKDALVQEKINLDGFKKQIAVNDAKARYNFNLEGQVESLLSTLLSQLNSQITDREKKLLKYTANSDEVQAIDRDILITKQAIVNNIQMASDRNQERIEMYDDKIRVAQLEIESLPADAKAMITLQQEYTIKQKILSNLTEERLKSQITLSAIEPGASVIYDAVPSGVPVSPNARRIYTMALVAGLGAGLFLILVARLLNGRIADIGTVQRLSRIPIMGVIKPVKSPVRRSDSMYIPLLDDPYSLFSESFRAFRNSLVFVLNKSQGKVICISSAMSGEGRSFIASNLASSLAQLDKKVVILDADLRKSSVSKSIDPNQPGLSAFLVNYESMSGIIRHTEEKKMDLVMSGVSPSNPSELILGDRMQQLIAQMRLMYDYVIIDTSPVAIFTDAVPIILAADLNLFVLRGGKSKLNAPSYMERLRKEYNLGNFFLVLNAFKKNPLYQPFDSDIDDNVYFNKYYKDYIKKYNSEIDESKWEQFQQHGV